MYIPTYEEFKELGIDEQREKLSALRSKFSNNQIASGMKISKSKLYTITSSLGVIGDRKKQTSIALPPQVINVQPQEVVLVPQKNKFEMFWLDNGDIIENQLSAIGIMLGNDRKYKVKLTVEEM